MKKFGLFLSIGLILLSGLGCNFITSQFEPSAKASPTPTVQIAKTQSGKATATPRLEPTSAPAATDTPAGSGMPQIVFVSCKSQNALGMGTNCGIYIMNEDGSGMRQVTKVSDDKTPALSPDGTRIAFMSMSRDRNQDIYVVNTDGSQLKRLTTDPGEDTAPAWSPDGSQILYGSTYMSTTPNQISMWVMGADGSNPHTLSKSPGSGPRMSPDGSQILFFTFKNNIAHLNIMDADGTHAQVLNTRPAQSMGGAVWSPDGSQIAFISQKSDKDKPELDIINKDGSGQRSLTNGYYVIFGGLSWSPDGQKLLFTMNGDGKSGKGNPQLYLVDVDGNGLHKLDAPCTYCYDGDWGK